MSRFNLCNFFPVIVLFLLPGISFSQHDSFDSKLHFPDVIVIKFQDGLQIDFSPENSNAINASIFSQETLTFFTKFEWIWPYQSDREELAKTLRNIPLSRSNTGRIPNITNRFNLRIKGDITIADALMELQKMEEVEYAYPIPLPVEPALAPDFETNQGYLNESPFGIDSRFMWDSMYLRGEGMKIVDIEYHFNPIHLDLPEIGVLGGRIYDFFGDDHGTAVLGQLGAIDNGWGVTGMAPEAELYFHYSFSEQNFLDIGSAVMNSALKIEEGDVILIEAQTAGPLYDPSAGNQFGLVPVEWFQPWYDDIVVAVAMGRVVVAAAGNGSQDLDDPVYLESNHQPFIEANNSGSIIVGAGSAPLEFNGSPPPRSRLWYSNYGTRVNLQGWGQRIYTTGYGSAYNGSGKNLHFTHSFGGTSGASPIVTAAAALLQQAYKNFYGGLLTGPEILEILEITGLPQSGGNPASQNIGPMPDLKAALAYLDIPICNRFPEFSFAVDSFDCQTESGALIRPDSIFDNQEDFSYLWNTGDTSLVLEVFNQGEYELAISDSLGCRQFFSFEVEVPDSIRIVTEVSGEFCGKQVSANLEIELISQLSDSVLLFLDGSPVGKQIQGLSNGTYKLIASAGLACSTSVVLEIPEGEVIDFALTGKTILERDEPITFSAGIDTFEVYEWTVQGAEILSGQGSPNLEVSWPEAGTYRLMLKAGSSNCQQSKGFRILVEEPVSVVDKEEFSTINIYPNPSTDLINIVLEGKTSTAELEVMIYTLDGKLVYSVGQQKFPMQIDLSSFPVATYQLFLKQGGKLVADRKIVVQR